MLDTSPHAGASSPRVTADMIEMSSKVAPSRLTIDFEVEEVARDEGRVSFSSGSAITIGG